MKPAATGEAQEVKVKVRINQNGILLISSAQMVEKKAEEEQLNGENEPQSPTEPAPEGQTPSGEPMDTQEAVSDRSSCVLVSLNPGHLYMRLEVADESQNDSSVNSEKLRILSQLQKVNIV